MTWVRNKAATTREGHSPGTVVTWCDGWVSLGPDGILPSELGFSLRPGAAIGSDSLVLGKVTSRGGVLLPRGCTLLQSCPRTTFGGLDNSEHQFSSQVDSGPRKRDTAAFQTVSYT